MKYVLMAIGDPVYISIEKNRRYTEICKYSTSRTGGGGNGLGASGLLEGYLGKVQERAASLESCPWCAANGQIRALRSYRINLHKSITLCTDRLCLFPLVSRPLEDVLPSLAPHETQSLAGGKRKTPSGSENTSPKRARSAEWDVMVVPEEAVAQDVTVRERTCQSEPTDRVNHSFPIPEMARVWAEGCRKDSDRPEPEKIRNVDDKGEGGPTPAYLSHVAMETVSATEEVKVTSSLQESARATEKTLAAPKLALSVQGNASFTEALAKVPLAPQMSVHAVDGSASPLIPDLEDTVCLLDALTAPATPRQVKMHPPSQQNVSAAEEAAFPSAGGDPPRTDGGPSTPLSALQEAVAMLEEVLPITEATPEVESVQMSQEPLSVFQEASVVNQDVLSVFQEAKKEAEPSNMSDEEEEEVSALVTLEVATASEEVMEVSPVLVEAASEKNTEEEDEAGACASSTQVDNRSEQALPDIDEEHEEDRPPVVSCRRCSVDLSQSIVPEVFLGNEDTEKVLLVLGMEEGEPCQSKVSDVEDVVVNEDSDGLVQAKRRQNGRQLVSSEEETTDISEYKEGEVTLQEVDILPQPKKKITRSRKKPYLKYRPMVIPEFDPALILEGEFVPVPGPHLFWKNENSTLCWLDSFLVALVHCSSLRGRRPTKRPGDGHPVWDLCDRYDRACNLITAYQQTGTGDMMQTPSTILQRVQMEMEAVRISIFNLLEPQIKCQPGRRKTPVFALPLLLQADPWVEPLIQHAYEWQFDCTWGTCSHATRFKCKKTLTTFSNVVPDWHPLNAAYQTRCSKCNKSKQNRTLVLESVAPVLVLHFAEGLPDNDVTIYSFTFQQQRYSVSTVIQYDQKRQHYITWIRTTDGSWLEFDDLKHPSSASYAQLVVPPKEIHVVFWEVETDQVPQELASRFPKDLTSSFSLPSSPTCPDLAKLSVNKSPVPCRIVSETDTTLPTGGLDDDDDDMDTTSMYNKDSSTALTPDVLVQPQNPDTSVTSLHDNTAIVDALTVSDRADDDADVTVTAGNASIGSATLLDTFEGLTHSDVVTLTLVELKVDFEGKPLDNSHVSPAAGENEHLSSLRSVSFPEAEVTSAAPEMTHSTREILQTSPEMTAEVSSPACEVMSQSDSLSETDIEGDVNRRPSSPDTASEFLPDSSSSSELDSGQPRHRTKATNRPERTSRAPIASKTSPATLPPVEPGIILPSVQSTMSSTCLEVGATPLTSCSTSSCRTSTPQTKPSVPAPLDPKARWSYLLTRHPGQAPQTSPARVPQRPQTSPAPLNQVDCSKPNEFQPLTQSRQPAPAVSTPNPCPWLAKPPPCAKPKLRKEDNEALPMKAAEMYGGFQVRSKNVNPVSSRPPNQLAAVTTDPQGDVRTTPSPPRARVLQKLPVNDHNAAAVTARPSSAGFPVLPNVPSSRKHTSGGQSLKPAVLTETDNLRHKLLKQLKAKKKKLEKLNQALGYQEGGAGAVTLTPDSTNLSSPVTVSSSTSVYDSPAYNEFFADLLSAAPSVCNLSPDSTGFLDVLATNGQEGGTAFVGNSVGGASQVVTSLTSQQANHATGVPQLGLDGPVTASGETFLDEFMSGSASQTAMGTEALSDLDMFF
ncbi:hypothetical protein DPEC_G00229030 [Dallia pectoralis]|uniref:Uncharacterized protein n=1 Tax=Dallia pectoralis TaxID=75939 RepID=A0ACC2G1M2_DALPE|nr:hypothetical protein DPEC_G00229030 [Dallia pectoralis]